MITSSLLAQSEIWPTFLTPIWLISVGVTAGLLLAAIALGLLFVLSRIPGIGDLADKPTMRRPVGFAVAIILFGLGLYYLIPVALANAGGDSLYERISQIGLAVLVLAPASLFIAFALIAMCSRRAVSEIPMALREGVLYWITVIGCGMAGFAVLGLLLAWVSGFGIFLIVRDPIAILQSYPRTFVTGRVEKSYSVPFQEDADSVLDVSFDGSELQSLQFKTDQEVILATSEINDELPGQKMIRVPVQRDAQVSWTRGLDADGPIPNGPVDKLYVRNMGDAEATLTITFNTIPENSEVSVVTTIALAVLAIYLLYFLQRAVMPKVSAVSLSTFKTEIAQPLFMLWVVLGLFFMLISVYIPYNTFGEDIKMLKDSGLTLILVAGIFLAVWAASKSVADEIEGRTALTVLSKPISRREFILGKFLGIAWALALLFIILGIGFLLAVAYKPIYDARESAAGAVSWQTCFYEMTQIVPGLVLAYMETLVFVAISIAISTRLPIMANFPICLAIYILGHLTPLMVKSSVAIQAFEGVVFIGQLIATVIPVLDHFNVQAAVAGGTQIPSIYLGYSLIYCFIYGTIAMLLALVLFEDRDLA